MAKLYFRYSAMNAGKSTALLQIAYNYENDLGQGVLIFTSAVDDRFGVGKVTSRLGVGRDAQIYNSQTNFHSAIMGFVDKNADSKFGLTLHNNMRLACILIDEAQFLTYEQVVHIHRFAHLQDVPVICFGLRSDFMGKPFPGSSALLTLADGIEELKTVCSHCRKNKATMNARINKDGTRILYGAQIGIEGEKHRYAPMCAKCFYEAGDRIKKIS